MIKLNLLVLAVSLICCCFAETPLENGSQQKLTCLCFDSSPGDYIGQGMHKQFLEKEDGQFSISTNGTKGVSLRFTNSDRICWSVEFSAPNDQILRPGVYKQAQRHSFNEKDHPGLSISGCGRGCNTLGGEFEILELIYGHDGQVESFAANFVQKCERSFPPLFGSIRYHSSVPLEARFMNSILYICSCHSTSPSKSSRTIKSDGSNFIITPLPYGGNGIGIQISGNENEVWAFNFAAPWGKDFDESFYNGAVRYPFQDSFSPGMEVDEPNGAISFSEGTFEVLQIEKDSEGVIKSLALDFSVCGRNDQLYTGAIRFNSNYPINMSEILN